METIPVIYARGGKLTSWLIRLFTWSKWSHVAVVTESGRHVIESVGGRGVIYTPIAEFRARYKTYQEAGQLVGSEVRVSGTSATEFTVSPVSGESMAEEEEEEMAEE